MESIKTFVSFSSSDVSFVEHLLARLADLDLNPWDYSRAGSELPLGQEIRASLKEKIAISSLFIAIVSKNSTTSENCHAEVAHAVELYAQRRIRIVMIVDRAWSDSKNAWPGPFAELREKHLRYCKVDIKEPLDAELVLQEICQYLDKPYEPPARDTPNFPFLIRLHQELIKGVFVREDKRNSTYRSLWETQIQFNRFVQNSNYAEALGEIKFLLKMLERLLPGEQFYYPVIAKGICQAECGQLREALETFLSLENHPLRDSNVSGGIGSVLNRQRRYQKAAEVYEDAWRCNRNDLALLHGYVINTLFAGDKITYEDVCNWVSGCRADDPVSLSKISEIKFLALLSNARHSEAERYFNLLSNDIHALLGVIIQWSEALLRKNRPSEALEALTSFYEYFLDNIAFLEQLARVHGERDDPTNYIAIMDQLIDLKPNEWKYVMKKALELLKLGQKEEATKLSEDIASRERIGSNDNSYYRGMAYHVLGKDELAQFLFMESKRGEEWEYARVIPKMPRI